MTSNEGATVTISVVQWTTGNVGKESVKAIVANPDLELVGCFAWSDSKVGVDVGELVGIDPIGVTATDDVDALLALAPDVVVYNPMWPSVDELVRILDAGVDVVTTAAFITGGRLGDERERLVDACERGGSSLFGTGVSPGFAELVADHDRRHLQPRRQGRRSARRPTRRSTTRPTPSASPASATRSTTPTCTRWPRPARRCSARPWRWSPTRSASSSTRSSASRSSPRPPPTSRWRRGPSPPATSPASPPAGRAASAAARSSTSTCAGRRARRSSPTGSSRRTGG